MLVKKSNKTWHMRIDFTDLDKACPKDSYPLPKIDKLLDVTVGHALLSFIDAYSVHHQILSIEVIRRKLPSSPI